MRIAFPTLVLFMAIIWVALGIRTIDSNLPGRIAEHDRITSEGGIMDTNPELKGSQVDLSKVLPEEVSRQLAEKAASIAEVQGADVIGAQRIAAHLFMGAAIAMKGMTRKAEADWLSGLARESAAASFDHDPVMKGL